MKFEQKEAYSLHRYVDSSGIPDYEQIFSDGDSRFWVRRHIDPWLLGHLKNQPDIVRDDHFLNKHLRECGECLGKKIND